MAAANPIKEVKEALSGFLAPPNTEAAKEARAKALCESHGGTWDPVNKLCIPAPRPSIPAQSKTPEAKTTAPEVFKSQDTGKLSGITLPDGRSFVGVSPEEVKNLSQKFQEKTALPEGTLPAGTAQRQLETQLRNQQLVQMAQQGLLTTEELQSITGSKLDVGQALGAGAIGAAPGIIGGAVTGATVGALGGPIGAAGGAIIGGLGAFLIGMRSNIKSQQTDEFAGDVTALTKGQTMLRSLITDTNQNPQNAPENIALFYHTLNLIDAAHAKTWKDSQENLNVFLGNDGTPQLAKFETFDATMRFYYINQFEAALAQPNAAKVLITADDLGVETE